MRIGTLQTRESQETVQQIFDNSPQIQYSNGWTLNKFLNTNNPPKNETSHSTGASGSTMFISFFGSQVNASGTIPAGDGPIAANYIFDNGQTFTISVPSAPQDILHQTLFRSPVLEDGFHNLTVQIVQTGLGRDYTFQQFNISTSGSGTSTGGSNMATSSGNDTSTGQSSSSPSSTANAGRGGANTTAILCGILGAVILILLVILFSFCFWRRKRASAVHRFTERSLPPPVYFARPISDGSEKERDMYWNDSASVIDTNSKYTFVVPKSTGNQSSQSWVSVSRPPSIPKSALISPGAVPDWSTYKGSSVINQDRRTLRTVDRDASDWSSYKPSSTVYLQRQPDRSHFSPYSSALSSMALREPTPRAVPKGDLPSSEDGSRSSLSSLPPPFERGMF